MHDQAYAHHLGGHDGHAPYDAHHYDPHTGFGYDGHHVQHGLYE